MGGVQLEVETLAKPRERTPSRLVESLPIPHHRFEAISQQGADGPSFVGGHHEHFPKQCLLSGDVDTGKAILRDYSNGTIGFEELSDRTHTPAKSLMRMFGPKGTPQAKNLFDAWPRTYRTGCRGGRIWLAIVGSAIAKAGVAPSTAAGTVSGAACRIHGHSRRSSSRPFFHT